MNDLTDDERAGFAEAAARFLAHRERMELVATGELANPGELLAPYFELHQLLFGIRQAHPNLSGIRFRGWIFLVPTTVGQLLFPIREDGLIRVEG